MDSETEVYSNSIEMEGREDESSDDREARLLKGICANGDFKEQLTEYPLIPTLQHGYVMIGLGEPRGESVDSYGMANPVSWYCYLLENQKHFKNINQGTTR